MVAGSGGAGGPGFPEQPLAGRREAREGGHGRRKAQRQRGSLSTPPGYGRRKLATAGKFPSPRAVWSPPHDCPSCLVLAVGRCSAACSPCVGSPSRSDSDLPALRRQPAQPPSSEPPNKSTDPINRPINPQTRFVAKERGQVYCQRSTALRPWLNGSRYPGPGVPVAMDWLSYGQDFPLSPRPGKDAASVSLFTDTSKSRIPPDVFGCHPLPCACWFSQNLSICRPVILSSSLGRVGVFLFSLGEVFGIEGAWYHLSAMRLRLYSYAQHE